LGGITEVVKGKKSPLESFWVTGEIRFLAKKEGGGGATLFCRTGYDAEGTGRMGSEKS